MSRGGQDACSPARASLERPVVMGPCVRRDDGGFCGDVSGQQQHASKARGYPHTRRRPGLEPGPIPRDVAWGQNACSPARASLERPVVMGPCVRRDDSGFVVTSVDNSNTLQNITGTIVLSGAGKMGSAMLTGWLSRGLDPKRVVVVEPSPSPDISAL